MASSARIDELRKKFDENPRRYFAPLANEYRKSGDAEQAIFICQEYLPAQPGHMSGHIVYGQALFDLTRYDEARTVFETALSLDPENLIALRHLGDIARIIGDTNSARGWYQRVLEADPRNEEIAQLMLALLQDESAARIASTASPTPLSNSTSNLTVASPARSPTPLSSSSVIDTGYGYGLGDAAQSPSPSAWSGPVAPIEEARKPSPHRPKDADLLDLDDFDLGGVPLSDLRTSSPTPAYQSAHVADKPGVGHDMPSMKDQGTTDDADAHHSTDDEEEFQPFSLGEGMPSHDRTTINLDPSPHRDTHVAGADDSNGDVDMLIVNVDGGPDISFQADPFAIAASSGPSDFEREGDGPMHSLLDFSTDASHESQPEPAPEAQHTIDHDLLSGNEGASLAPTMDAAPATSIVDAMDGLETFEPGVFITGASSDVIAPADHADHADHAGNPNGLQMESFFEVSPAHIPTESREGSVSDVTSPLMPHENAHAETLTTGAPEVFGEVFEEWTLGGVASHGTAAEQPMADEPTDHGSRTHDPIADESMTDASSAHHSVADGSMNDASSAHDPIADEPVAHIPAVEDSSVYASADVSDHEFLGDGAGADRSVAEADAPEAAAVEAASPDAVQEEATVIGHDGASVATRDLTDETTDRVFGHDIEHEVASEHLSPNEESLIDGSHSSGDASEASPVETVLAEADGAAATAESDVPPVPEPEAFVTETMAELYLEQGHLESALDIYRKLVGQRPNDSTLIARMRAIEHRVFGTPAKSMAAVDETSDDVSIGVSGHSTAIEPAHSFGGPTIREFLVGLIRPVLAVPMPDVSAEFADELASGDTARAGASEALAFDDAMSSDLDGPLARTNESAHIDHAIDAVLDDYAGVPVDLQGEDNQHSTETQSNVSAFADSPSEGVPSTEAGSRQYSAGETVSSSLGALFSGADATASDAAAAHTLAQAFASSEPETSALDGMPAHRASDELSLDHVFKSNAALRASGEGDGFSFDQFFSAEAADAPVETHTDPAAASSEGADDIAQFNAWLNGLKKT